MPIKSFTTLLTTGRLAKWDRDDGSIQVDLEVHARVYYPAKWTAELALLELQAIRRHPDHTAGEGLRNLGDIWKRHCMSTAESWLRHIITEWARRIKQNPRLPL